MKRYILAIVLASSVASATIPATSQGTKAIPARTSTPVSLVSAPDATESTISLALVNTHVPLRIEAAARALAGDVNLERVKHGISPLTRDAALDRLANAKAVDMAAHAYFGHTSPQGVTFQDRMRAGRWPTQYVSENIAFDVDEPAANRAFVNSPPHFANLVDPNERRIGVAVVTVGTRETFYVEDFSQ